MREVDCFVPDGLAVKSTGPEDDVKENADVLWNPKSNETAAADRL